MFWKYAKILLLAVAVIVVATLSSTSIAIGFLVACLAYEKYRKPKSKKSHKTKAVKS